MSLAEKGQQMMLAERVEVDIFLHDHFFVVFGKHRVVDHFGRIHLVAPRQESKGLGDPLRSLQ